MFLERQMIPPEPVFSDFSSVPPLYLRRSALDRIVQNVIINAAKYGRDRDDIRKRPLRIFAATNDQHYILVFQDWGRGIPTEEADKIFDEEYRGNGIQEIEVTGNGMGLFIARDLAQNELGGDLILACNQEPTEFRLLLPTRLRDKEAR